GFHTANYPGVTVTLSRGKSRPQFGSEINLVDLPGVHSTVAPSPEEELSCTVLEGRHKSIHSDALIIVVDATQLERNLKFAAFASRLKKPMVIALTMMDLLSTTGLSVSPNKLQQALGVPVIPIDGRTTFGVEELVTELRQAIANPDKQQFALADLPDEPIAAYQRIRELIDHSGAVRKSKALKVADDSITTRIDRI